MGNKNTGKKLTRRHIRKIITDYMIMAQIKSKLNCVHALRHFFITEALNNRCSIRNIKKSVHHRHYAGTEIYISDKERINNRPAEYFITNI